MLKKQLRTTLRHIGTFSYSCLPWASYYFRWVTCTETKQQKQVVSNLPIRQQLRVRQVRDGVERKLVAHSMNETIKPNVKQGTEMSEYSTIKELVIETCMSEEAFPSYEKLTSLVLKHFPTSKWKKSHYAWYKSKIKSGDIPVPGFDSDTQINTDSNETETEVQETIDFSLSLERDLHQYLSTRTAEIEKGLALLENGVEYQTDAGRIDLLAKDEQGSSVVIELKAGKAKDNALGQILGYIGCLASNADEHRNVRGILVASDFEQRVVYAAKGLPNIKLVKYKVSFDLEEID